MELNREKYIDLITYLLFKTCNKRNSGKTVISTIMYFIDFNYYELYGKLLTKETYIKSKKGIKPKHFNEITNELISKKQIYMRKEPYYNRTVHKYYLTIIPNCKFTKNEQRIIDSTLQQLSDNNAHSISQYAKYDSPLIMADFGESLDYRYVFSRSENYSKIKKKNK